MTYFQKQTEFEIWFAKKYSVNVYFIDGELQIPPRSGKSVPAIAHVAWAAWQEACKASNRTLTEA